jgi:hypothetical protein
MKGSNKQTASIDFFTANSLSIFLIQSDELKIGNLKLHFYPAESPRAGIKKPRKPGFNATGGKNLSAGAHAVAVSALCLRDRIYRTNFGAGAAIGAGIRIDNKLVIALADGFYRTGGLTGATRNALAGNYMCHDDSP